MNGLATIVATQSLQLGAVSVNSAIRSILVVVFIATNVVVFATSIVFLFLLWISFKVVFLTFLGNVTSQLEFLKFKNFRILQPSRFV